MVLEELTNIFRDVLEDDDIQIDNSTTSNDIDDWDSLNHIYLVVEIEKQFKIKFSSREILQWNNVGDMIKSITTLIDN